MKNTRMPIWTVRILLTVLCAFAVGFILYNSMQPAAESVQQSSAAVELVQQVVSVVAPDSSLATATGEDYDRLHNFVRSLAHFTEYALLGALGGWCLRSYTDRKKWLNLPLCGIIGLAIADECLQMLVEGRGAQFADVLVDWLGGGLGLAFALFAVWSVGKIVQKRRAHETR